MFHTGFRDGNRFTQGGNRMKKTAVILTLLILAGAGLARHGKCNGIIDPSSVPGECKGPNCNRGSTYTAPPGSGLGTGGGGPATPSLRSRARRLYNTGYNYYKSKNYQTALKYFRAAARLDPGYSKAKKAITALKARINQIESDRLEALGNRFYNGRNYAKAIEYYKKALRLTPNDAYLRQSLNLARAWLNYDQGNRHYDKKEYLAAMQCYQRALRYKPGDMSISKNLRLAKAWQAFQMGETYFKIGSYAAAVKQFQKALRHNPGSKSIAAKLSRAVYKNTLFTADTHMFNKKYRQALIHYKKALKLNPHSKELKSKLKKAEDAQGQAKQAKKHGGRAVNAARSGHAEKAKQQSSMVFEGNTKQRRATRVGSVDATHQKAVVGKPVAIPGGMEKHPLVKNIITEREDLVRQLGAVEVELKRIRANRIKYPAGRATWDIAEAKAKDMISRLRSRILYRDYELERAVSKLRD
jgi:tetratricopeptide (TPR) repeat protein